MVSAIEASIGILKVIYKHYMDNNENADFKHRHIYVFLIAKTNISIFSDICVIPNRHTVCTSAQLLFYVERLIACLFIYLSVRPSIRPPDSIYLSNVMQF